MLYRNVQAMRGVAALAVAVSHLLTSLSAFFKSNGHDAGILAILADWSQPLGDIGVGVFFVVSGFVLVVSAERLVTSRHGDAAGPPAPLTFAVHRFVRIFPPYWVAFAAMVLTASLIVPDYAASAAFGDWREILLVDGTSRYEVIPQAWTLMYEVYFYACVTVCLTFGARGFRRALYGWLAFQSIVIAAAWCGVVARLDPATDTLLLQFMGGCAIALTMADRRPHRPKLALAASAPLLLAALIFVWSGDDTVPLERLCRVLSIGAFAVALVYALIHLERQNRFVIRGLQRVGDASYSIYLWHVFAYFVASWIGTRFGLYSFENAFGIAAVWLAAAVTLGFASYHFVERPLLAVLRSPQLRGTPRLAMSRSSPIHAP